MRPAVSNGTHSQEPKMINTFISLLNKLKKKGDGKKDLRFNSDQQ